MADVSDDAYRLQIQAERWQALVVRQQGIALRLRTLVGEQRELADLWEAAGAEGISGEARAVVESLRDDSSRLFQLEQQAVDLIATNIAKAATEMRPE